MMLVVYIPWIDRVMGFGFGFNEANKAKMQALLSAMRRAA